MPFIPKLPTWNTEITPYLWQNDEQTFIPGIPFQGQVYTMKRVAEVEGVEAMYVVYPKEEMQLRDPKIWDRLVGDAISFLHRGNRRYWFVFQQAPRWLNFPNEHNMVLITELNKTQKDELLALLATWVPDPAQSEIQVVIGTAFADGVSALELLVIARNAAGQVIPGASASIAASSANPTPAPASQNTDANGEALFTATSLVEETGITWTATVAGVSIGPSLPTQFIEDFTGWQFDVDIGAVGNGTCATCTGHPANVTLTWDQTLSDWRSAAFSPWACAGEDAYWRFSQAGDIMKLIFITDPGLFTIVEYEADISSWDWESPITFNFQFDDGTCTWPATVQVERL